MSCVVVLMHALQHLAIMHPYAWGIRLRLERCCSTLRIKYGVCQRIPCCAEHEELFDAKDYLASTGKEVNGLVVDGQFRG